MTRGQGLSPRRIKHHDVHIDFTPMIDCMFLLLMFNIFAFALTGTSDIDLPKAKYAQGNDAAQATTIIIRQPTQTSGETRIQIEGSNQRAASLDDVRAATQRGLTEGKAQVVLKAERRVPVGELMKVAAAVGEVPGVSLLLAVQYGK